MGPFTNAIGTIKRRLLFPGVIVFSGTGALTNAYADWKQVGFAGKEITAITNGVDPFNSQPIVLVGTKDSGVYVLSPRVSANHWTLSLKVKAYGVASPTPNNSAAIYAATADGVWKYEPATGVDIGMVEKFPFYHTTITGVYSINGRKIASGARLKRMTGVFIIAQQTGKCKKVLSEMGNRP